MSTAAARLRLSPRYKVLPNGPTSFIIYGPEETAYRIRSEKLDLFPLFEKLSEGIAIDDFLASRPYSSAEQIQIQATFQRLEAIGAIRTVEDDLSTAGEERERFDRELRYFDVQEAVDPGNCLARLRKSSVLLIGVGGLGSWVLQHLIASGVGRLSLVDHDHVSLDNLSRQCLYGTEDIGLPKVSAATSLARRLSKFTDVSGAKRQVCSTSDILELIGQSGPFSLFILTADEPSWKISCWAAEAALKSKVPLIRGNHLGIGPFYLPGKTACPACDWPRLKRRFPHAFSVIDRMRHSPLMKQKAALSTELSMAGAFLAHEAISYLSGVRKVDTYDAQIKVSLSREPRLTRVRFPRENECPVCGDA